MALFNITSTEQAFSYVNDPLVYIPFIIIVITSLLYFLSRRRKKPESPSVEFLIQRILSIDQNIQNAHKELDELYRIFKGGKA